MGILNVKMASIQLTDEIQFEIYFLLLMLAKKMLLNISGSYYKYICIFFVNL